MPDNLASLHDHEEDIRRDSLAVIEGDPHLRRHLSVIHGAMCVIFALAHDHVNLSPDELTVQYLGLRLFNSAASSVKLALSGYYQSALTLVRDLFETTALLDYLQRFPQKIAVWKASDNKQLKSEFGPAAIRKALDEDDGFEGKKRQEVYQRFSQYAAHPTPPGFKLLAPEGLGEIGPFLSKKYLKAWIEETAQLLVLGGMVFSLHFARVEPSVLAVQSAFLSEAAQWRGRYLGGAATRGQPT